MEHRLFQEREDGASDGGPPSPLWPWVYAVAVFVTVLLVALIARI